MAINLSKFVDIKLNYHLTTQSSSSRDTAVLIVGESSETKREKDFEKLEDFEDAHAIGSPLYYYGYCFFSNGGKKLKVIYKPLKRKFELTGNNQELGFTSSSFYLSDKTPATPLNSNLPVSDRNPLYEEHYEKTSDTEPVEGKTYYKFEDNNYVVVSNPEQSEMETYYELSYVPTEDQSFASGKYYYLNAEGEKATPSKCNLYEYTSLSSSLDANDILEEVNQLSTEYIVIASDVSYEVMKQVNENYNTEDKSIFSKIFLSSLTLDEYTSAKSANKAFASNKDGFVLKCGVKGVEMTAAAYLTQINANRFNSVKDYDFTIENVIVTDESGATTITSVVDDGDTVESLMEDEINVVSTLVNAKRNLGGNDTNGNDLVNEFMLILLHQTLTERLVQLLTQKIKYNQTGLSLIGATVASELQKYVDNGYLTTDKVWTDPDLSYEGITIISQNTPLQIGYKYVVMPFSSLTNEERAQHKLPPIYILIADSYTIRRIEITGEVF